MSRITGNLAAATAFALLAAFLYLARDENGGWRTDRLCLTTSGITCPATATEDVHATDAKSNNSAQSDSKRGRKTKKKGSSSAPMPLPKELKDDATGIALPRTKRFSSKSDFTCLGVGVRAKSIAVAKVNVYTVGLYVDSKSARGALKKYSGLDPSQLRKDASLFKTLGQPGGFARYLHLVFARGLGAQKVVDALTAVKGVNDDVLSRCVYALFEVCSARLARVFGVIPPVVLCRYL